MNEHQKLKENENRNKIIDIILTLIVVIGVGLVGFIISGIFYQLMK